MQKDLINTFCEIRLGMHQSAHSYVSVMLHPRTITCTSRRIKLTGLWVK